MKTITMVDLRTHSESVIRDLMRGVRMRLSYRGRSVAELVPMPAEGVPSPLEALEQAHAAYRAKPKAIAAYLRELRADQIAWGKRS